MSNYYWIPHEERGMSQPLFLLNCEGLFEDRSGYPRERGLFDGLRKLVAEWRE